MTLQPDLYRRESTINEAIPGTPIAGKPAIRHDWTREEVLAIHDQPLLDLVYQAAGVHREHFGDNKVQLCSLLSIKTGGCPEDCGYCPQSARHPTAVKAEPLMDVEAVLHSARTAREAGATRFCMGAAWRHVKDGRSFDSVLEMVSGVKELGMEACVTLGMINASQAKRLKEAGLTSYNHNHDTSPEHYAKVISTRTYEERLDTIKNVREAGIEVCCGGILGLGESEDDRAGLLMTLANLPEHPGSVPINALVAVTGTPLENEKGVQSTELVRAIATARIMMPKSMVRLSAGRQSLNEEAQLLCFMAGANSIFYGEKLLTTANPELAADRAMMERAGVEALEPRV